MGADLYIKSISDQEQKRWLPQFTHAVRKRDATTSEEEKKRQQERVSYYFDKLYAEGYFRDSYNSNSVAVQLGFSWWGDILPLLDDNRYLSVKDAKWLRELVRQSNVPSVDKLGLNNAHTDDDKNSLTSWREYFIIKQGKLLAFLSEAIELGEPIYCSL